MSLNDKLLMYRCFFAHEPTQLRVDTAKKYIDMEQIQFGITDLWRPDGISHLSLHLCIYAIHTLVWSLHFEMHLQLEAAFVYNYSYM